jgi:hypothetical protein
MACVAVTVCLLTLFQAGTAIAANRAGLVVIHGDGRVVKRVVTFEQASLTGTGLLRLSGLSSSISNGSAGQAVYAIDGEGDPNGWVTQNGRNYYWSYFRLSRGKWVYSPVGAGQTTVKNGDVEGWMWQYYGQNAIPPLVTFNELAGVATSTAKKAAANRYSGRDYLIWGAMAGVLAGIILYLFFRKPASAV